MSAFGGAGGPGGSGRTSFARAWKLMWASLTKGQHATKKYIGEDAFGNRFYELEGTRQGRGTQVSRGYDPPAGNFAAKPPVEWLAWLQRTRRFPPSDEELRLSADARDRLAQLQHAEDTAVEQRAPKIETKGPGAADMDRRYSHGGHHKYPVYEGMELAGGAQKQQQSEKPPEKKHNSSEDNKPTGSTSGREKDQQ